MKLYVILYICISMSLINQKDFIHYCMYNYWHLLSEVMILVITPSFVSLLVTTLTTLHILTILLWIIIGHLLSVVIILVMSLSVLSILVITLDMLTIIKLVITLSVVSKLVTILHTFIRHVFNRKLKLFKLAFTFKWLNLILIVSRK